MSDAMLNFKLRMRCAMRRKILAGARERVLGSVLDSRWEMRWQAR